MKVIRLQRQHMTDASIVRIMKTRKELMHNALVSEVMQQLQARFKPRASDIKKRIEAMMDQEYLKRKEGKRSVYQYVA